MPFNHLIRSRHLISQLPFRISNCLSANSKNSSNQILLRQNNYYNLSTFSTTQQEICKFDGRRKNNLKSAAVAVKSFSTSSFKQKVNLRYEDTYTWERWWKSRVPVNNFRFEIDPYFDEEHFLQQVKGVRKFSF